MEPCVLLQNISIRLIVVFLIDGLANLTLVGCICQLWCLLIYLGIGDGVFRDLDGNCSLNWCIICWWYDIVLKKQLKELNMKEAEAGTFNNHEQ
jgi:hypothetical protein